MEIKSGLKTTEFWITMAINMWSFLSPTVPAPYNIVVPAVVTGLYSIARGLAKAGILKGSVGNDLVVNNDGEIK